MNYIVFVYDSLRADRISHLGYNRETSPHLDSLARDGVSFSKAFSQAYWTGPSSGSIMTSKYPLVHRTGFLYRSESEQTTIADPFQKEGFTTGCITTSKAVDQSNYPNFDYHDHIYENIKLSDPKLGDYISRRVIEWISKNKNDDFFLFVWSDGTHTPYDVPESWNNKFLTEDVDGSPSNLKSTSSDKNDNIIDLYDENIRYNDQKLGEIINHLEKLGIYDETTLVITADHGEIFEEHNRIELAPGWFKWGINSTLPEEFRIRQSLTNSSGWSGHQSILPYDGLMNVPLIIKSPHVESSGNIDKLAQTIDIGPTLCNLESNVSLPQSFQGQTLIPAITEGQDVNEYVYSFTPILFGAYIHKTIRSDSFKYITSETKSINKHLWKEFKSNPVRMLTSLVQYLSEPNEILFELPGSEQTNMIKEFPGKANELSDQMSSVQWRSEDFQMGINDETVDHLEDLGYLN